ncbi:MAG TPA: glycoside hydrolase family 30 beta sandwich domain-containing protein [Chitinispirillaceae bacterium]|nr:glycoside hydrolase family 30 beta sandwich domain-containing protein [Chitinispirillaceae bacterium]
MGQYSKYVHPVAVRVDATRKVQTDVYTSAFKKADSVVLVVVNRATSSKTVSFSIPGLKSTSGAKITTSGTKSLASDGSVTVSDGNFSTTLDAQSTSTLVFTGNDETIITDLKPVSVIRPARAGVYRVFDMSGKMIGQVNAAKGTTVNAEIHRIFPKAGLYLAKPLDDSYSITVNILP